MSAKFSQVVFYAAIAVALIVLQGKPAVTQQQPPPTTKIAGTIKDIGGQVLTVANDEGTISVVQVDSSTRIYRIEVGQKDLKTATPLTLGELTAGDRVVVRGSASPDSKNLKAVMIMAMSRADVAAKQEHDRQQWQRNGTGGLVTAVNPAAGNITITITTLAGKKTTLIQVSKNTIVRRYAPDSVKFEDAKPANLEQIKVGDQLRARGTRSSDGQELSADEIVAGTFRNIVGTVISTDLPTNTVTVMDSMIKKPVKVTLSSDSQLHKLPPEMAQRIAMRLKGGNAESTSEKSPMGNPGMPASGGETVHRNNGSPDFQQMLSHVPPVSIRDLKKDDAVMIVSTEGTSTGAVTAITLLAGVEPILAVSPKGGEGMVLSPWTLGGGGGEDAGQ